MAAAGAGAARAGVATGVTSAFGEGLGTSGGAVRVLFEGALLLSSVGAGATGRVGATAGAGGALKVGLGGLMSGAIIDTISGADSNSGGKGASRHVSNGTPAATWAATASPASTQRCAGDNSEAVRQAGPERCEARSGVRGMAEV